MNYRIIVLFISFLLFGCETTQKTKINETYNIENRYQNSGFALVYNSNLKDIKKLDTRSLTIYHKSLKENL